MTLQRSQISVGFFAATTALGLLLIGKGKSAGVYMAIGGGVCLMLNILYNMSSKGTNEENKIEDDWNLASTDGNITREQDYHNNSTNQRKDQSKQEEELVQQQLFAGDGPTPSHFEDVSLKDDHSKEARVEHSPTVITKIINYLSSWSPFHQGTQDKAHSR